MGDLMSAFDTTPVENVEEASENKLTYQENSPPITPPPSPPPSCPPPPPARQIRTISRTSSSPSSPSSPLSSLSCPPAPKSIRTISRTPSSSSPPSPPSTPPISTLSSPPPAPIPLTRIVSRTHIDEISEKDKLFKFCHFILVELMSGLFNFEDKQRCEKLVNEVLNWIKAQKDGVEDRFFQEKYDMSGQFLFKKSVKQLDNRKYFDYF